MDIMPCVMEHPSGQLRSGVTVVSPPNLSTCSLFTVRSRKVLNIVYTLLSSNWSMSVIMCFGHKSIHNSTQVTVRNILRKTSTKCLQGLCVKEIEVRKKKITFNHFINCYFNTTSFINTQGKKSNFFPHLCIL